MRQIKLRCVGISEKHIGAELKNDKGTQFREGSQENPLQVDNILADAQRTGRNEP